jgi:hypothetical protein
MVNLGAAGIVAQRRLFLLTIYHLLRAHCRGNSPTLRAALPGKTLAEAGLPPLVATQGKDARPQVCVAVPAVAKRIVIVLHSCTWMQQQQHFPGRGFAFLPNHVALQWGQEKV